MRVFWTEFYPNWKKKNRNLAEFHWQLQVKCDFHCIDFHETHNGSTGLSANLLYQISTKSVKKYGPYKFMMSLTLNTSIPSLARQRCLPSWGPRRTPWFFCNFSTVWCGRLLKLCFFGFWNYNSVIQALLASNILCLFISTEVTSPHSLITHPASEQCHLLSIVGGPFFKFTTFRT